MVLHGEVPIFLVLGYRQRAAGLAAEAAAMVPAVAAIPPAAAAITLAAAILAIMIRIIRGTTIRLIREGGQELRGHPFLGLQVAVILTLHKIHLVLRIWVLTKSSELLSLTILVHCPNSRI